MKIGAILRCDYTGLGIQSKEFFDHIPCKALVIDAHKLSGQQQNLHWFPDQPVFTMKMGLKIPFDVINEFLNGVDVLMTFETPYDYSVYDICRKRGVKTILQLNYEFLEYPSKFPPPDLFASPSLWHYDDIPGPKIFLPVPVNTSRQVPEKSPGVFLHIAGRSAIHDRNGTMTFLNSLKHVKSDITVYVRSQQYFQAPRVPRNVKLFLDYTNKDDYWENYSGGVLVMPRKYGGLCLPMQEAIAMEMPVIATAISPNDTWLPANWLVPVRHAGSFRCKQHVDFYEANERELALKIDEFSDQEVYETAVKKAISIKERLSWEKLLPLYHSTLGLIHEVR